MVVMSVSNPNCSVRVAAVRVPEPASPRGLRQTPTKGARRPEPAAFVQALRAGRTVCAKTESLLPDRASRLRDCVWPAPCSSGESDRRETPLSRPRRRCSMLTAHDVMTEDPATISMTATVGEAVRLLQTLDVRHLPV